MTVRCALALVGATVMLVTACQGHPAPAGGTRPVAPEPPAAPSPAAPSGAAPTPDATPHASANSAGLSPGTTIVTVRRTGRSVSLAPKDAAPALEALQNVLAEVGTLTPEPDGPRILANLRVNERLLDVAVWTPQTLSVGGRWLTDVSGIVIPFTGPWRNRVVVVREGAVEASQTLLENLDLAALERVVESRGGHP